MAEIENVPSNRQVSATPSAQRRRHHSEAQASAPQETSTTTCMVDNGSTVLRSVGLRNSDPSAAAMKHPTASTALSRPVRGPVEFGWVGSLDASSDAGLTSSTHNLGADDITSA